MALGCSSILVAGGEDRFCCGNIYSREKHRFSTMVTYCEAISLPQGKMPPSSSSENAGALSFKSNLRPKSMASCNAPRFDPHSTLGVAQDASKTEIQRAYRHLALKHHPRDGDQSTTNFKLVSLAYETLLGTPTPEFSYETLVSMASPQFAKFEGENVEGVGGGEWEEWMGFEGAAGPVDDFHPVCNEEVLDCSDLIRKALEVLSGNYWEEWMGWKGASGSPLHSIPHFN